MTALIIVMGISFLICAWNMILIYYQRKAEFMAKTALQLELGEASYLVMRDGRKVKIADHPLSELEVAELQQKASIYFTENLRGNNGR